jgi:predicted outer membrane repeat protein
VGEPHAKALAAHLHPSPRLPPKVNGGAINVFNGASAKVVGCTFDSASAARGAAIYASSTTDVVTLEVNDSTFSLCTSDAAGPGGGAIYASGGATTLTAVKVTVSNSVFTGNHAHLTSGLGGAIAVVNHFDELTLTNSSLIGNLASDGGAIYAGATTKLTVSGSVFKRNGYHATVNGGAVSSFCSNALISGSSFLGAFQAAMALSFYCGGTPVPVTVDSCLFDATLLPDETAADATGTLQVTLTGAGVAATLTRNTFLNGGGGACTAVNAVVRRAPVVWACMPPSTACA